MPTGQTSSTIAHLRECGERDNRHPATFILNRFPLPDRRDYSKPIHLGHLTIHKNQVIGHPCRRGNRLPSILYGIDLVTQQLQHLKRHFTIDRIVFG
ncbi:MAG: hypothetical protein ABIQ79_05040 [Nitrospiraceae bacterium]